MGSEMNFSTLLHMHVLDFQKCSVVSSMLVSMSMPVSF